MASSTANPSDRDFAANAQYRYGIVRFIVRLAEDSEPLWLRSVAVILSGPDGVSDDFAFDIGAPIRMNPGGRTVDHWRPRKIDLEDPSSKRPHMSIQIEASRRRRKPVVVTPSLTIDDGFEVVDGELTLDPQSPFALEIEERSRLRLDGLTTREG